MFSVLGSLHAEKNFDFVPLRSNKQLEINMTPEVDIGKLLAYGSGAYSLFSVVLYPLSVLKTRLQSVSQGCGMLYEIRQVWSTVGFRGFFAGVGPMLCGALPARIVYISGLENAKSASYKLLQPCRLSPSTKIMLSSAAGGFTACTMSQLIYVPFDVISQRMMVSCSSTRPASASSVVHDILRSQGVSGLYRGFGVSLITYLPGSSIWWGSYGVSKAWLIDLDLFDRRFSESMNTLLAATWAAGCATLATNPLDTLKVRVQLDTSANPSSLLSHATSLLKSEGLAGLYRGAGPRSLHLAIWGGCIVSLYEELKRRCSRPPSYGRC